MTGRLLFYFKCSNRVSELSLHILSELNMEDIMAEIINLNKKRKAKNRLDKEKQATENRIKFGRTKKEKLIEKQDKERNERHLDGHKLDKQDKK